MSESIQPGTLYVVSTPIGNLDDVSFRAVKILAGVDLVAAEDTRKTGILLNHLSLKKPLISYHSYNEGRRVSALMRELAAGKSVAVVTDAGTPGVSDPAYSVIREAIRNHVHVVPIPGATAFLPALIKSGMPMDRFVFEGFLPAKKGRVKRLQQLKDDPRTIILYEAPHRIVRTLGDVLQYIGDRDVALVREITKKFEEALRGKASEVLEGLRSRKIQGELVLVVQGCGRLEKQNRMSK